MKVISRPWPKVVYIKKFKPDSLRSYCAVMNKIIVCSNDDSGLTLTYFTARSNFVTWASPYEKVKAVDFSEINAAIDPKIGRSRHPIEFMKVYEY